MSSRPLAVYAAMGANLVIAISKFVGAGLTGSSAMMSEGIHSVVDTGNELVLLLGLKRGRRPADEGHPFGHGKEVYFWSLIVAMMLFGIGGGMSVYEGITRLLHRDGHLADPTASYVILAIAAVVESSSFLIAFRKLTGENPGRNIVQAIHFSKNSPVFTVLMEDAADLAGLLVAFLGVFLSHAFGNPIFDAAGSLVIGAILAFVAVFLAMETRGLLIGESAGRRTVQDILDLTDEDPAVDAAGRALTMHMGPGEVLVNMNVRFSEHLSAEEIPNVIDRIKARIRAAHPEIRHISIEVDSFEDAGPPLRHDAARPRPLRPPKITHPTNRRSI